MSPENAGDTSPVGCRAPLSPDKKHAVDFRPGKATASVITCFCLRGLEASLFPRARASSRGSVEVRAPGPRLSWEGSSTCG